MERERVTISIKKDLLKKIDHTIDGTTVRNRSHAIEHLVSSALDNNVTQNAVILIGGKGAQKLLPSVIDVLSSLKDLGLDRVYVALGSFADNIKETLGNGEEYDLNIEYITKGEGTAGALLPLKKRFKETFIVVNPDTETAELDIKQLIEFHRNKHNVATIGTNNLKELKGVYVFEPEIFNLIPEEFSMLEEDIFPKLSENGQLVVYPVLG